MSFVKFYKSFPSRYFYKKNIENREKLRYNYCVDLILFWLNKAEETR